jgi:hypothetical protein
MNKFLLAALISLFSCPINPPAKTTITHFNITFAPDLSNRVDPNLYKRPLNDVDILKIVTNDLYPSILRYRRSENQKDKLLIDLVNKGLINQYQINTDKLLIDFGRFKNQNERINYIMERGVQRTLKKDAVEMVNEFNRVNTKAASQNFGADIWTYFNQGIDERIVLKPETFPGDQGETYVNNYRNILILTTDGYIEAGIFNKGFDLSKKKIDAFRNAYLLSGETDLNTFFKKNNQLHIRPVHNEALKNLEVLVMELYDRSLSKTGSATIQPTDMEIMKLFWADWLQASKVKRFELHTIANSKAEAEKVVLNFLGINKIQ